MENEVCIVVQTGHHDKRSELIELLRDISSVNSKIVLEERDLPHRLQSPVSFFLESDGSDTGITFSGIPGGHEFNSLILSILHASGTKMKIDSGIKELISRIDKELKFEVFISLSCQNCPEVVQTLNQFALMNNYVTSEMIDGGLFQNQIKERDIQGVPSVYLNGEIFANGKVDASVLVAKLIDKYPEIVTNQNETKLPLQDITIIGGGPAGASAAIYAARKGLAVTVIAERFGGQLKDTLGIENLISIPKTSGHEVTDALTQHMNEYDITLKENVFVKSVSNKEIKTLLLSSGEKVHSRTLIIATGARWKELGIPGEKENIGNGVAYCPHCDGPFFKGKDVAVIGGGNSGIEAAIDLAGIVKSVTVLEFLPDLRADAVIVDQAKKRNNIEIITNVETKKIVAKEGKVSGIEYMNRDSKQMKTISLSGVFIQIGLVPNSQFLGEILDLSVHGEIIVNEKGATSCAGIFAAGDVTTTPYKQIIISMGEGAKAALGAFEYLMLHPVKEKDELAA